MGSRLFPSNPSTTLAPQLARRLALSELLHLAYACYYLLVYVPPTVALPAAGTRRVRVHDAGAHPGVRRVLRHVLALPRRRTAVSGRAPRRRPTDRARRFVLALLEQGSSRGTAFPSSHVAASVVAALCALRFQRRVGVVVALATGLLTVATVYGGFHYAVDALVGVILGLLAWLGSAALWKALASRGAQIATAD